MIYMLLCTIIGYIVMFVKTEDDDDCLFGAFVGALIGLLIYVIFG